jgi:chemotaxis protein CheD
MENIYLYPSKIFVSKSETKILTILGSCVSICLYDVKNKYGGMNHYMLPLWNGNELPTPKYGNIAIPKLIEKMENLGSNKKNLVAKMFGGGDVLETKNDIFNIGQRNVDLGREILSNYNIPIISESVRGVFGRKIIFNNINNQVQHKFIKKNKNYEEKD